MPGTSSGKRRPRSTPRPSSTRPTAIGHSQPQLPPGADAQLGEHLAQVPFDRTGADEKLGGDLRIRPALARQPRNERLLLRELLDGVDTALAYGRAGGQQFAT